MRTRRIAILIFDDFEPIDVWGFVQAFSIARFLGKTYSDPPPYPFEVVLVAAEKRPIRSYNGPKAMPDYDLEEASKENFDVLMVPGGYGTRKLVGDRAMLDWLIAMDERVGILASVCTGAAVLAKAGLLDGQPAATNHASFGWVVQQGPDVLWDSVSRWVDAGHHVSSAGVSAGTDMAFYLVMRLAGRAVAENAVKGAEYDWHRDPEQPIYYPPQAKV